MCLTGCTPNSNPRTSGGSDRCDGGDAQCGQPPVVLEIVDRKSGNVVSGTTQNKIVGQKIELSVRARPAEAISGIQWTVPGQRVKNYTQARGAGTRTDLAAGDLQGANLDFYWIAGGNQAVTVSAVVRGARQTASVTHNVLAPTGLSMTSVTGVVAADNPGFGGGIELHFGNNGTAGIAWTFKATAPAGGAGEIAGTQLTNPHRVRTANDDTATTFSSGGAWQLDTTVPYAAAVAIAAGAAATWTSDDTPGTPLTSDLKKKTVHDQFRIYLMYKPAGGDSIWVTLGRLDWEWKGESTRTGAPAANTWTAPTGVSNSHNPSGAASTELPVWTANAADLTWR